MSRWIALLLILIAQAGAAQAADFAWQDQAGHSQRLEQVQHGEPVLVHLWASWCPPCRAELKAFDEWRQAHPEVRVLMVSLDKQRRDAVDFLHEQGIDRQVLMTDPPQARNLGANSLPTTVIVASDGSIARIHRGPRDWRNEAFSTDVLASLKPGS